MSSSSPLHAVLMTIVFTLPLSAFAASPSATMHPARAPHRTHAARQIEGDARIVHALNRLTFGARSGDVATVKSMGIETWIDRQLHPERIDDSALDAKLKSYPAMQMSVQNLIQQLPPPPVIRQAIKGKLSIPQNQPAMAIYQTQMALIEMREQVRAEKRVDQNPTLSITRGMTPSDANALAAQQGVRVNRNEPGIAARKQQVLADLQATGIVNLTPEERMTKLIAMQPLERISFYRDLTPEERIAFVAGLTPTQAQTFAAMQNPVRTVASQVEATKILRVVDSNRQLQQVMLDFWLNHFNVDIRKSPMMSYYLTEYESQVIAPHALGNFEDLLVATARSPAMLLYLDNASSVGPHSIAAMRTERVNTFANPQKKQPAPGLNENYGRELMELQTVGVNTGYTQQDVIEVAKAFTGWTIEKPLQGGGFVFNPLRHEPGPKVVLGHTIQEHGEEEGLEVLHILATSPATAHHISEELAERFVSDHPPQALVNRMARTFLATHGDIRQVLRTMFFSPEFWSTDTLNAKVKTPLEFVASAARASNTQVERPVMLALAVARLGMPLYGCQPPTGYSANADAWVSSGSLVERMNFAMAFADNRLPWLTNHWDTLIGDDVASMTASQKEARLEKVLLHGDISSTTHDAVVEQLTAATTEAPQHSFALGHGAAQGYILPIDLSVPSTSRKHPLPSDSQAATTAGLLIGSPDFQSR
jgi:uncharacterized protein (DUF1800 family)